MNGIKTWLTTWHFVYILKESDLKFEYFINCKLITALKKKPAVAPSFKGDVGGFGAGHGLPPAFGWCTGGPPPSFCLGLGGWLVG